MMGPSLHYDIKREVFWAQADAALPVYLDQVPFQTVRVEVPTRRIFAVPHGRLRRDRRPVGNQNGCTGSSCSVWIPTASC